MRDFPGVTIADVQRALNRHIQILQFAGPVAASSPSP
jgi:hypothetical protein